MSQVVIKVTEGPSTLVVRVYLSSDGTGELTNYPILAPMDLNPSRPNNRPTFRIMQVWYGLVWFDVSISSGTIAPVPLWTIARDSNSHTDFRSFGGLIDQNVYAVQPSSDSGILNISTNGFAPAGSQGSLVLQLTKTNAP